MNKLYVGPEPDIELPSPNRRSKRGFLFIHDEVPDVPDAKIFDPRKHSINLLEEMDYRRACNFVDGLLALMPGGETTLTKEAAQFIILEELLRKPTSLVGLIPPSKDAMREKARQLIDRLMISPILRRVLCGDANFSLDPKAPILARVNRAELGHFDADAITLFLMAFYPGQLIMPRFGVYGRDTHVDLIEQDRLIAGVDFVGQLPDKLRQAVMLIPEKIARGCTAEDAEVLAIYEGHVRNTTGFHDFVKGAMA